MFFKPIFSFRFHCETQYFNPALFIVHIIKNPQPVHSQTVLWLT